MTISFTKVSGPYGWLGNMAPYPVFYDDAQWRTTEALFQAFRFPRGPIRELIRAEKSPMAAKMVAKKHSEKMSVVPMSSEDVENMMVVLRLKLKYHPQLRDQLLATGDEEIVEDVTSRNRSGNHDFWGARLQSLGVWVGTNTLGKLWMQLRKELQTEITSDDIKVYVTGG